jgi:hypothetical protein
MRAIGLIVVALFSVIYLPIVATSCSHENISNSNSDIFWFTDPPDVFHTNDLQRAQKEIPFTIVLPNYLPNDFSPCPYMIEGPLGASVEDTINVRITYQEKSISDYAIFIDEQNTSFNTNIMDSDGTWFTIAGVQIFEGEFDSEKLFSSETQIVMGLYYKWNQNGIDINVDFLGFEQNEARKVIESMVLIEQT